MQTRCKLVDKPNPVERGRRGRENVRCKMYFGQRTYLLINEYAHFIFQCDDGLMAHCWHVFQIVRSRQSMGRNRIGCWNASRIRSIEESGLAANAQRFALGRTSGEFEPSESLSHPLVFDRQSLKSYYSLPFFAVIPSLLRCTNEMQQSGCVARAWTDGARREARNGKFRACELRSFTWYVSGALLREWLLSLVHSGGVISPFMICARTFSSSFAISFSRFSPAYQRAGGPRTEFSVCGAN